MPEGRSALEVIARERRRCTVREDDVDPDSSRVARSIFVGACFVNRPRRLRIIADVRMAMQGPRRGACYPTLLGARAGGLMPGGSPSPSLSPLQDWGIKLPNPDGREGPESRCAPRFSIRAQRGCRKPLSRQLGAHGLIVRGRL